MKDTLSGVVEWHWDTAVRVLRATPAWVLLVPVAGMLVIYLLNTSPDIAPYLDKEHAEFISPIILAFGVIIAAALAATRLEPYFYWLVIFAFCLLLRELHFRGTNAGFYIAIVLLIWWASHARDQLEPFISDRKIATLLMAALWTYLISKTFDRHWWDAQMTARVSRDLFEENLEILGHVLFVVLVIVSTFVEGPLPLERPH